MRRIIVLAVCFTLVQLSLQAQTVKFGVKIGISTPDIKPADVNPITSDSILLKVADAGYGFHVGGWMRLRSGNFMFQPELLFNSSKVTYSAKALKGTAIADTLKKETFNNIDFPLMLGVKLSGIRLMAGPVGHLHLSSSSELSEIKSYSEEFNSLTWGYQAGIGADFGKIAIDIRYEGNFNKYGDHIIISGKPYSFDKKPSRFLVSMAIAF